MFLCKRMIKIIVEIHINLKCINLRNLFPVSALHCLKTVTWKDLIKKNPQKQPGKCQFEANTIRDSAAKFNIRSAEYFRLLF